MQIAILEDNLNEMPKPFSWEKQEVHGPQLSNLSENSPCRYVNVMQNFSNPVIAIN